jgi:hypothetical protein
MLVANFRLHGENKADLKQAKTTASFSLPVGQEYRTVLIISVPKTKTDLSLSHAGERASERTALPRRRKRVHMLSPCAPVCELLISQSCQTCSHLLPFILGSPEGL